MISAAAIALVTIAQATRDGPRYHYARSRAISRFEAAEKEILATDKSSLWKPGDLVRDLTAAFDKLTEDHRG